MTTDRRCSQEHCVVAETGECLLRHVPVSTCPHVLEVQTEPPSASQFHEYTPIPGGYEIGTADASPIMAERYTRVIGILGDVDTGKTSLLCSLYLLACRNELPPATLFAGSQTLLGYETRLWRIREWDKQSAHPRLMDHTVLSDPRRPAYLHMSLSYREQLSDLLFADVPGEWTRRLRVGPRDGRFEYLQRCDGIVIACRATDMHEPNRRHRHLEDQRLLLRRLGEMGETVRTTPLLIAATHMDEVGPTVPLQARELLSFAEEFGFRDVTILGIASWSNNPDIPSGFGVGSAFSWLTKPYRQTTHRVAPETTRWFGRFGSP